MQSLLIYHILTNRKSASFNSTSEDLLLQKKVHLEIKSSANIILQTNIPHTKAIEMFHLINGIRESSDGLQNK